MRPSHRLCKAGGGGLGPNAQNQVAVLALFGAKNQNGAAGARLWQTKHGGAFFQVEGTLLEWGTLGLRWWGGLVRQSTRGGAG